MFMTRGVVQDFEFFAFMEEEDQDQEEVEDEEEEAEVQKAERNIGTSILHAQLLIQNLNHTRTIGGAASAVVNLKGIVFSEKKSKTKYKI